MSALRKAVARLLGVAALAVTGSSLLQACGVDADIRPDPPHRPSAALGSPTAGTHAAVDRVIAAKQAARIERGRITRIVRISASSEPAMPSGASRTNAPRPTPDGFRVTVQLDDGRSQEFIEAAADGLRVGDVVQVVLAGAGRT